MTGEKTFYETINFGPNFHFYQYPVSTPLEVLTTPTRGKDNQRPYPTLYNIADTIDIGK